MTQKTELYVPKGATTNASYTVDIDPKRAGWTHSSLRIVELGPDGTHTFTTGDSEWIVLSLNGGCTVQVSEEPGNSDPDGVTEFQILGRESVFAGVSDFVYAPRDARVQIASGAGGRFALAGAKCERRLPARYGPAPEVPVEDRGSGNCARQVRNFASADAFECDKLITVEVITPGGNWSSYPPHKHDENRPGEETELEEIYYFEIDGPNGFGYQRVSPSREGGSEVLAEVRSGDAVLVPDGWHGPSIAQPGHSMYYLNVMAGPGSERKWQICFHPDHTEGYR
ncbi:5-deoxy-glucuronate isomerase [Streptomyces griseiscabiei]|uniref:5-deoxy-glucuronate isomerase n=1 Tax=Streptomyces griseiscabiei TaxID=2993540 RepID=A0ABU4L043_9ACTN|nr:5-deoxy-glucuronate isomerase [Streptomyces griseiscabiei]MBZ3900846.1 5-deoxy-glucuronate isomerase [Streptomyces griseiscabiei]MDX2909026.1 5-deoxy-glucuronate isomerase [Streptomyces griseiscabiei]